jgi:NAD(P)-dependent dehydrogenase (short-subunit alcohol dehydrogenase family)
MGASVEAAEQATVSSIPIGRMIESEDIAALILFLVSAQASAITGQVIAVDGGAGRGITY